MTWTAAKRIFILTLVIAGTLPAMRGAAAEEAQMFFTAIAGQASDGETPILLRWYSSGDLPPADEFTIYRKAGDASSPGPMKAIGATSRLRNIPLIKSILDMPQQLRAKADIMAILREILDVPVTEDSYIEQLLQLLDESGDCNNCQLRRNMMIQSNYAVAIIEGYGYLDTVASGVYTYELRTAAAQEEDRIVLGRATIDASTPTQLAAPQQPEFIDVPGERGHLKVYLRWDLSAELADQRAAMFGYNVYRGTGDLSSSDFDALMAAGQLRKINSVPILPPAGQAVSGGEDNSYFFMDDNLKREKTGPAGIPFRAGDRFTYWVTARDLLGQNGLPSPPIVEVVPDKRAPRIPRGLHTRVVEIAGQKRIFLEWDRNTDDTASYNIYRFRQYDHVGRTDAYSPIDGLTEGLISSIPQPAAGNPKYADPNIKLPQDENKAFWYCLSAVDSSGNVSALSPPIRGVIFDETPPDAPAQPQICVQQENCSLHNIAMGTFKGTSGDVEVEIRIQKETRGPLSLSVARETTVWTEGRQQTSITTIYSGAFPNDDPLVVKDQFAKTDSYTYIRYIVTIHTNRGQICKTFYIPREDDQNGYKTINGYAHEGVDIHIECKAGIQLETICRPSEPGGVTHIPVDESGMVDPVTFVIDRPTDASGIILYRSPNCTDYYPVDEVYYEDGAATLTVEDHFNPQQGGRVCYAIQAFDENHNTSSITYIETQVLIPADIANAIVPSMQNAEPLGDSTAPEMKLTWFGPASSIAAFRIEFATAENFASLAGQVQVSSNQYAFDSENSIYSAKLNKIDASGEPIAIDQTYFIRAAALMQNGDERDSNNYLSFIWTQEVGPFDHPVWPVRDMPPAISSVIWGYWLQPLTNPPSPFTYGVGVKIGSLTVSEKQLAEIDLDIAPPFIVYRQRADKADRTYKQISPLIEKIDIDQYGSLSDPFFALRYYWQTQPPVDQNRKENIKAIFFLDTVNLIYGAEYRYKIATLDAETGEIVKVYGPTNTVEVVDP
ncbi:MAG: hypothetical protein AB1656_25315 [Candidatus Omnitrophota bacterium]